jgi:chromate transporter
MNLILLCLEFFKTGLLSIGGGLATLPFLYEMADKYPWFTRSQLSDMIAVSESTPGPMGVNMATYAGYSTAGIPGAVLATFSLVLPSILVILLVARFLEHFQNSVWVKRVLEGLRPASVGLIAAAGWGILKIALLTERADSSFGWMLNYRSMVLCVALAVLYHFFQKKWHPIVFIGLGAVAGLVLGL